MAKSNENKIKNMISYEGIRIGRAIKSKDGIYFLEVKKPGKDVYTKIPVTQLMRDIMDAADKAV